MEKSYKYEFATKNDMLEKLYSYSHTDDDDTIRIKKNIKDALLHCPELLYCMKDPELEKELFTSDGKLNVGEDGEPLGEWDRYFGDFAPIRPYLFIPETQSEKNNYLCYQVSFQDSPLRNNTEKYCIITFVIFINEKDAIDKDTGIPRHDLIGSIIREKMAWSGICGNKMIPTSDKESTTDNSFLTRTLMYETTLPNSLVKTDKNFTYLNNKRKY